MGILQRRKGANAERDIVNILKDHGVPAKRISMMETNGEDKGDLQIMEVYRGQVKCGEFVPKMFYEVFKNGEEFGFVRRDREDWVVCMKLDFFLEKFL